MKKNIALFTVIGIVVLLVACGGSNSTSENKSSGNTENTTTNSDKKVYSGEELYTQKCTACHGSDGNLGIGGAKKISESTLTQDERVELITNGKKTMPAFKGQLSDEEIKALAEFTFTLK